VKLVQVTTADVSLSLLLSYQLQRFALEGFEVVAVSAPGPHVAELDPSVRHVAVAHLTRNWTPGKDARALAELLGVFRREAPSLVQTHNPKSGVLGRLAARIERVPVVINTVHGLYRTTGSTPARRLAIERAERWAMKLSDHEFFQSAEDHQEAVSSGMVPASRASWLGNGVDLRRFDPLRVDPSERGELRRRWGIRDSDRVIGAVGRLVREKGYPELFEAFEEVRLTNPDARLVVVGPSEPEKADGLGAHELDHAQRRGVIFHGEAKPPQMPAIYSAFDVSVLASHREGMPRSAIEAQAMALPAVVTDVRGCREVVIDGVTGWVVPPESPRDLAAALVRLLEDPAKASELGAAGHERAVENFDEAAVVERTLRVYRRLLETKRQRPSR